MTNLKAFEAATTREAARGGDHEGTCFEATGDLLRGDHEGSRSGVRRLRGIRGKPIGSSPF